MEDLEEQSPSVLEDVNNHSNSSHENNRFAQQPAGIFKTEEELSQRGRRQRQERPRVSYQMAPSVLMLILVLLSVLVALTFAIVFPRLYDVNENEAQVQIDPLPVELPIFDEGITAGYENENDLDQALTYASNWVLNHALFRPSYPTAFVGTTMGRGDTDFVAMDGGGGAADSSSTTDGDTSSTTNFETNNQEKGVDEADVVKADANFVYAVHDDSILVWDLNGQEVTRLSMPPIEQPAYNPSYCGLYPGQKAEISSLLLVEDQYLIVFVMGYAPSLLEQAFGTSPRQPDHFVQEDFTQTRLRECPILQDYLATQIRIYKTSSLLSASLGNDNTTNNPRELEFIRHTNIHGKFVDARATEDGNIHVVTSSTIDVWTSLVNPIVEYQYSDATFLQSKVNKVVPNFVQRLHQELLVSNTDDSHLPTMLQLNQWQTSSTTSEHFFDQMLFGSNVMKSLVHVTSFRVDEEVATQDNQFSVSSSAYFSPSSFIRMYSTQEKLILLSEGWNWSDDEETSIQTTYLLALQLNGPTTSFVSVGHVQGHLLNSYAVDVVENLNEPPLLRVATTIRSRWFFGNQIATRDSSLTENYMIVLEMNDDQMSERGRVAIGEPNEVITAVRFFDNDIAYAVTFERTDPFYVLDMATPAVLGEVKLPGFSTYLHSMKDDNTVLVAIGQNATQDTGRPTGLMVTVFDATDPTQPTVLVSYTVDDENSHSGAEWDFKAFRFVDNKVIIPLDIWDYDAPERNFRGFTVLDVTTSAIRQAFRVEHNQGCDYYCGYSIPPRSFVYNGDLMTIYGNTAVSTDLLTEQEVWRFTLFSSSNNVDGERTTGCCHYS